MSSLEMDIVLCSILRYSDLSIFIVEIFKAWSENDQFRPKEDKEM